jgi:hypothetical protein
MKAYVDVNNTRRLGRILKRNGKTIWVKIMTGAKTSFKVKRHIIKHNVRFV